MDGFLISFLLTRIGSNGVSGRTVSYRVKILGRPRLVRPRPVRPSPRNLKPKSPFYGRGGGVGGTGVFSGLILYVSDMLFGGFARILEMSFLCVVRAVSP